MKEYRNFSGEVYSRSDESSRLVEGYAIRFNEESQNMGFYETISPEAISEETLKNSDIYAKLDHRDDVILARSRFGEGSLHLELREDGVYYSFEAPNTAFGDELLEHIRRGEITTSSFAFSLAPEEGAERWYRNGETIKRTILKIDRLYDVSPVFEPAYLSTSCNTRNAKEEEVKALIEKVDQELDKALEDLKQVCKK